MKNCLIVSVVLLLIAFATGNPEDPCYGVRDGIHVNNPESCSAYFSCSGGVGTPGSCPPQFYFNFYLQFCDWPENVDCVNTTPTTTAPSTETEPNIPSHSTGTPTETTGTESTPLQTTTEKQTEVPITTTAEGSTSDETDEQTTSTVEITTEAVTEPSSPCYGLNNGILVGSAGNCEIFFHCVDNSAFQNKCPSGLLFNGVYCDLQERVTCSGETTTDITTTVSETTTEAETEGPVDPEANCVGKPDGSFLNNLESCPAFYYCLGGSAFPSTCPDPFFFNPINGLCDWPHEVDCSDEREPPPHPTTTENPGSQETTTSEPTTETPVTDTQEPDTDQPSTGISTTEDPVTEPQQSICLPGAVGLHPHSSNCTLYYLCFNGELFELPCNTGEHFSSEINGCVPREQANCRLEDPVCDPIESENRAIYSPHPHFCEQFFVCFRGNLLRLSCSVGEHWDHDRKSCVAASESQCVV